MSKDSAALPSTETPWRSSPSTFMLSRSAPASSDFGISVKKCPCCGQKLTVIVGCEPHTMLQALRQAAGVPLLTSLEGEQIYKTSLKNSAVSLSRTEERSSPTLISRKQNLGVLLSFAILCLAALA